MIKIGVIGAGHLGKIHISLIKNVPGFELVGFYDSDKEMTNIVSKQENLYAFKSVEALISKIDAIIIVTPTKSHFEYAACALKNSKHVFIEKPVTSNLKEAENLIKLANEANVKVQVGHVERFNPAFISARPLICNPMFVEMSRLAQFNPRGTDVSVVLDLMIHDIDIVLSTVKSNIKKISAGGVAVLSDTSDIANARIEFDNGCTANLTASRISLKNMRKCRFFQRDAYISIDFLNKEAEVVKMSSAVESFEKTGIDIDLSIENSSKQIYQNHLEIKQYNAIEEELKSFHDAIVNGTSPLVSLEDGYNALSVAFEILEKIKSASPHV